MRPDNLSTRIFLDGGDPNETKEMLELLGFLDGQTTNPTLIARNPEAQKRISTGDGFSKDEIYRFYHAVVADIANRIPGGSVSVEVYADRSTTADEMLRQGREMFSWIPNAHIKFPITAAGLDAAERAIHEGMRVNMTLCFSEEQGAAVYAATKGAHKGDVFLSPFVGRLDDRGENGMDLIKNIITLYRGGDGHVEVLTASVRSIHHFLYALALNVDIITAPAKILREWAEGGMAMPDMKFVYESKGLSPIAFKNSSLAKDWKTYTIKHILTDAGIDRFAEDWNALIKK